MTASKMLFWFCIAFIIGIAIESLFNIPQTFIWAFLVFSILASLAPVLFIKQKEYKNLFTVLGFCVSFLVIGVLRFQIAEFNIDNDKLSKLNDLSEKITLTGIIIDGPDIRDSFQKIKLKIDNSDSVVLITLGRRPEYDYLDRIKITGHLKSPFITDDFNYKNYLMKDGIYSVMDFPKAELISKDHIYSMFSFLYEKILIFKDKLIDSIDSNFSKIHSPVLRGIIIGDDKNINKDLKDKFSSAGLNHVTAVSGGNIVILAWVLIPFLILLGLWRQQAIYLTFAFIWLYIFLVGLSASAVRAGIMVSILLLAQYFGRQNTSSRTIVLTAVLMVLQNPLLLFYDVGFQLSFLASMGIIHLKPIFDYLFSFINKNIPELILKIRIKNLFDIISVTISAQIFVLPIVAYNFKNISLISLVTNLLILPIIPLLMSLGFLSALLGIFSNFLGWVFYLPCWILLTYFLWILDIFYQPWALLNISITWYWFLIYYFLLGILIWFINKKIKPKFLGF